MVEETREMLEANGGRARSGGRWRRASARSHRARSCQGASGPRTSRSSSSRALSEPSQRTVNRARLWSLWG